MRRTLHKVEQNIMHRILAGDAYKDIAADTGVAISTIKKIKKRNYDMFWAQDATRDVSIKNEMFRILSNTNRVISRKLDRYGEKLSVKELLDISQEMHKQSVIDSNLRRVGTPPKDDLLKYL